MQDHISRYQLIEKIGEGVACSVYKAFDPSVNRQLAIKVLHGSGHNPQAVDHFLKETRVIGKLTHPGIATLYDIGEDDGQVYIAMELLSGAFLDDAMIARRHFSWEEVVDIGTQIASALQYAHKHGVIHADLRPGNIAWFADDKRVVLTDFSRALRDYVASESAAKRSVEPSKSAYMSPEQLLGTQLDARSDLFSLGTLLYQLLTGRRPFAADTLTGLTEQITKQQPKPLSAERSNIHERLIGIIERLLEKEPEQRYQSCDELLGDFEVLVRALSVERTRRGAGQRRNKMLAGLLVVAATLATVVFLARKPPPAEPQSQPVVPAPSVEKKPAPRIEDTAAPNPLVRDINQRLAQFDCAALTVKLDRENRATINGHVAQEDDMMRLMDVMEGIAKLRGVTYAVQHLVWPHCEIAAMLSPAHHSNVQRDPQLQIKLNQPVLRNKQFSGEFQNANADGFVYVDFYSKEGVVIHLYPQLGTTQQIVPAGASLRVEYDLTGSKISLEDDGLFVVLAAHEPLALGVTSQREPAQDYLSRLYRSIVVDKTPLLAIYELASLAE